MIEAECARQALTTPPTLWHFTIMSTSGALARRELADSGRAGYQPYVDRYNQLPAAERSTFARSWQPYLDGTMTFEQALHDLVPDAR